MNYLHEDSKSFINIIAEIKEITGMYGSIIEKDYWVFTILKDILSQLGDEFVFKGGTSLSKAYNVINRFSEDIDLCLVVEKYKSDGARKRLVNAILQSLAKYNLVNCTTRQIQRRGDYNDIRGSYISVARDNVVEPYIKIETAHRIKEYPYEKKVITSYVGEYICKTTGNYNFGLEPFYIQTVSVYRTFVDKLYAIADYYMANKVKRYSRHLYDVYKIICIINWNDIASIIYLRDLLNNVRLERLPYRKCMSAQDGVVLKDVLYQAMMSDFYKSDYNNLTAFILYENVSYEYCKIAILNLLNSALFT